jgi:hypothetical protein
MSLCHTVDG